MTNNIISSHKITKELFYQRPDFWHLNYLKDSKLLKWIKLLL